VERRVRKLDVYELEAQMRLEPLLGPLRQVDVSGAPSGTHDFEATLPDGTTAIIEVLSDPDPDRLRLESAASELALGLPGSSNYWVVRLAAGARVREIRKKPLGLLRLLGDVETAGRSMITGTEPGDPFDARLVALGAESAHAYPARSVPAGTVRVLAGVYGGGGWRASDVDSWLGTKLDPQRSNYHTDKLRGGPASERHLVLVLDSFSEAGVGVSLMLNTHNEPGAAGDFLPTFVPSSPVTHLWIFVSSSNAYLRWKKPEGWAIVG
jgi:hypothetical protein